MHDDQGLKQEEGGGGKEEILEKGDRQDAWNLQIYGISTGMMMTRGKMVSHNGRRPVINQHLCMGVPKQWQCR